MTPDASLLFAGISSPSTNWLVKPAGLTVLGAEVGVARDPQGRPALLVPAPGYPAELKLLTRGLTARVGALAQGSSYADWLMVTCQDSSLRDTFFGLCNAVMDRLGSLPADLDPVVEAMDVVKRWKALMETVSGDLLGVEQCAGLLVELHAMEELAARYGGAQALLAWSAGDRSRVDFRLPRSGVEVKATLQREQFKVTVHGLLQMDETQVGSLRLFAQQLEHVPSGGESIPDVVDRLVSVGVDAAELRSGLAGVGFLPKDEELYRAVRFKVLDERSLLVGPSTPRIVPSTLANPDLTGHVSGVAYQLNLSSLTADHGCFEDPRDAFEGLV
ncbi:hypothetical protein ASE01_07330 [Nocardioides sp. Root190]|uniref:PD-(D/E)XK motif protein n=1 Tax=Nocardioides sp. Root190 TaxID=1736488 RepID=UPI0006F57D9C|nr:PD-(D/E)XK motif protein [Nocardioides sp. Root190]KRB77980.1 hypothetical protein ASE01_07330 [Nocardioides sp. Root190]